MLLLIIIAVGMWLGVKGEVFFFFLFVILIGGVLVFGVVNVINCIYDSDIDYIMECICWCFILFGRVKFCDVLIFVLILVVILFILFIVFVNLLVVLLVMLGIVFYVGVYIYWLKCYSV